MATEKMTPKKAKEKRSIFFPIFLIIGAVIFGVFLLIIIASTQPTGDGIAGYDCKDVSNQITVLKDSITFPISGNCHFDTAELNPSIYSRTYGLQEMDKQLVLEQKCVSYVTDFYPGLRNINNLAPGTLAMYRDANGVVYACVGMGGT